MVEDQPREDILGLPHTVEGYEEAKRILKEKYGKDHKVHKALIKDIENLNSITNIHNLSGIHSFYNKLSRTVRTLTTMKKLESAQSTVYTLMDKLGPVREIIAQNDENWEKWSLQELVESLRRYVDRNPLRSSEEMKHEDKKQGNRDKLMFEQSHKQSRVNKCVYCGSGDHSMVNCTKVLDVAARKNIFKRNNLCYNCGGDNHRVSACKSRLCKKCGEKHHTSLCEKRVSTMPEQGKLVIQGHIGKSNSLTWH